VAITADSVTLTVDTATAGAQPNQATAATTYDITTNGGTDSKKITGVIDTVMATGLTLKATAAAPTGAISAGAQTLSTTAVDLVTGLEKVAVPGLALSFTLDATVDAGVVPLASKTFTMTIIGS